MGAFSKNMFMECGVSMTGMHGIGLEDTHLKKEIRHHCRAQRYFMSEVDTVPNIQSQARLRTTLSLPLSIADMENQQQGEA